MPLSTQPSSIDTIDQCIDSCAVAGYPNVDDSGVSLSNTDADPTPVARIVPSNARIEASSFCQLRCPSCPTTSGSIHPAVGSGFLRFEDFRKFLDSAPFLKKIERSNYGEVFLNPHLLHILEYAHARKVAITLQNGVNLNNVKDEVLEGLVKYEVRAITCSIDGASQETYEKYRRRGNFETVMSNIERINELKLVYESRWPILTWQFIVFGHNEHEISIAEQMAGQLGMRFITKLSWDSEFSPVRNKDLVRAQTGEPAVTREEYERVHGEKYKNKICHQLWDIPQINWDGRVLGCGRNFWGDFGGNAFADGFIEAVNHEKMVYARRMLTGRVPPRNDIPCTTCEMYLVMQAHSKFMDRVEDPVP
jgi:MoaA/NifB/PqqE/SkfB family radical SAM enzyme